MLPPPPPSPAPPRPTSTWPRDRIGGVVAAAAIVVGALLPWASVATPFGTISKAGTSGDGVITLVLGIVIGALFLRATGRGSIAVMVLAAIVAAIVGWDWLDLGRLEAGDGVAVTIDAGAGLFVSLLGALAAFFCALSERRRLAATSRAQA